MAAEEQDLINRTSSLYVVVLVDDPLRRERASAALNRSDLLLARNTEGVIAAARRERIGLVITDHVRLDGTLPDELVELGTNGTPVIVIADSERAGLKALEAGAADYVVDPFTLQELRGRALARLEKPTPRLLEYGDLHLHRDEHWVTVGGRIVDLTNREFDLLRFLAVHPGVTYSREELLKAVWRSSSEWQNPSTVTEHIYRIRHKTEMEAARPRWVVTVHGGGYEFRP